MQTQKLAPVLLTSSDPLLSVSRAAASTLTLERVIACACCVSSMSRLGSSTRSETLDHLSGCHINMLLRHCAPGPDKYWQMVGIGIFGFWVSSRWSASPRRACSACAMVPTLAAMAGVDSRWVSRARSWHATPNIMCTSCACEGFFRERFTCTGARQTDRRQAAASCIGSALCLGPLHTICFRPSCLRRRSSPNRLPQSPHVHCAAAHPRT